MVYLTREEYEALRERALGQYERLRAIVPDENEIVFAITRDVYLEAMIVDTDPRAYLTVGFGRNGFYGLFNGIRICVVNEETDYSMFAPAVCGRAYYQGMQLEDVILIEDNHLYSLRYTEPDVMFVDTGLTVSFTTARNMYIDNGFLGQMDIGQIVTQATRAAQEYHRKKVKPKKEEELNPGDTKALDDFLGGFMRSAT